MSLRYRKRRYDNSKWEVDAIIRRPRFVRDHIAVDTSKVVLNRIKSA